MKVSTNGQHNYPFSGQTAIANSNTRATGADACERKGEGRSVSRPSGALSGGWFEFRKRGKRLSRLAAEEGKESG